MRSCMGFLLVPIIWKIEVDVDITTIKVISGVYGKSDIFTNLPSHIVFITVRGLYLVSEPVRVDKSTTFKKHQWIANRLFHWLSTSLAWCTPVK